MCQSDCARKSRSWIYFCYYHVIRMLNKSPLVWPNQTQPFQFQTEARPSKNASESERRPFKSGVHSPRLQLCSQVN